MANIETRPFLSPRFKGSRFHKGAMPLNVLGEFVHLERMFVTLAKSAYLEQNPGRVRSLRGFEKMASIALAGSNEDGSSVPSLVLLFSSMAGSFQSSFLASPYEQARDQFFQAVRDANDGKQIDLEPAAIRHLARFGRSLAAGDEVDFAWKQGKTPAVFNAFTKQRFSEATEGEDYLAECSLVGRATGLESFDGTFNFRRTDGKAEWVPLPDALKPVVTDAFARFEKGKSAFVRVTGIASFDKDGVIKKLETIDDVVSLDPRDTTVRLIELANMKPGWLDGEGEVPTPEGISWLKGSFEDKFDVQLELPYLFLTEEGFILAEWDLPLGSVCLTIDTSNRSGELIVVGLGDGITSTETQLDLGNESDGWVRLNKIIRSLGATADES